MLKSRHKNIGVFLNKIDDYFQKITYRVLWEKAKQYGYNLVVFNSYVNQNSDKPYDILEEKIMDFAPVDNLDGILAVPDSYGDHMLQAHLTKVLKERCKCPIVYIRSFSDEYCSIGTDENNAIRGMVRHFIYDHHFTRIGYMGGTRGNYDAEMRYNCYVEEMKKAQLPIQENSVFHGDFWYTHGNAAAERFVSNPDCIPEAIVCANDYMAISLCNALKERGYRVPEDICVSGFDNTKVAREYEPAISTVAIDFAKMAETAMDAIHNMIEGIPQDKRIYIEPKLKFRASCRCCDEGDKNSLVRDTNQLERSAKLIDKQIQYNYFSVDMDSSNSMEDMHAILVKDLDWIEGYHDFYLCLFGHEDEQNEIAFTDYPLEESTLRFAFNDKQDCGIQNTRFPSRDILPEITRTDELKLYYITMLHNSEKFFGYTVVSFDEGKYFDIFFHSWNVTLSITIDEIYSKIRIRNLMKQIEEQSIIDPLTGLYNRRGFEIMVDKKWQETLRVNGSAVFIGIDLDQLKYVNDNFGHSEGDYSICVIADAMNKAAQETGAVTGRMGGDEFAAVIFNGTKADESVFEKTFYDSILKANQASHKNYPIDASLGYFITPITEEIRYKDCICRSDEDLYKKKRQRKALNVQMQ